MGRGGLDSGPMRLKDPSLLKDRSLIGGKWVGTPTLAVMNPATGAVLGSVPDLGKGEAEQAIAAAYDAFPSWSRRPAKDRGAILRRWYDLQIENKDDLALLMTSEQGKPLAEARAEVDYAASFTEFYAEEAKRILGEIIPSPKESGRVLVLKQPIGVVAAITPWNFPLAMITRKVSPALAAGCTNVCKPAPEAPLCALALAELASRAGMPPGVLNVITGDAEAIGGAFTSSPLVRMITFTGSTEIGKLLMRQSADTVKRVALELGGNAPFIVFDDADMDRAVLPGRSPPNTATRDRPAFAPTYPGAGRYLRSLCRETRRGSRQPQGRRWDRGGRHAGPSHQ